MKKILLLTTLILISCKNREPEFLKHEPNTKANQLFLKGNKEQLLENYSEAITLYEKALKADDKYKIVLEKLYQLYFITNCLEKAEKVNEKLISLEPEVYSHYVKQGFLREVLNKPNFQESYEKARIKFYKYKDFYAQKLEYVGYAMALIDIDSVQGRIELEKIISMKNGRIPKEFLINTLNQTHGEKINRIKNRLKKSLKEKITPSEPDESIEDLIDIN